MALHDDLALKIFHTDNLKDLYDNEYWKEFHMLFLSM